MREDFNPRRHQRIMLRFLARRRRVALHVDMGLGKTSCVILALWRAMCAGECRGALVFAPLRVATLTWPGEFRKWSFARSIRYSLVRGTEAERIAALRAPADFYLINYEWTAWIIDYCRKTYRKEKSLPFDRVVFDESSKLKSPSTARFKKLRHHLHKLPIRGEITMTGTPMPESFMDLWSQYFLIDGGKRLGPTFTGFQREYFDQDPWQTYKFEIKEGADKTITAKIADVTLSMRADDWLDDLPKLIDAPIECDMPAEAWRIYREIEKQLVSCLRGLEIDDPHADLLAVPGVAQAQQKCQQILAGAVYDANKIARHLHEAKFDAMDDMECDENLLIAFQFRFQRDVIRKRYKGAKILEGTDSECQRIVDDWNAGKIRRLFVHPASVGHGLNLQHGGRRLVFLATPWSCEQYQQTTRRLLRMGQRRTVFCHQIVIPGTVDEAISQAIASKGAAQGNLFQALRKFSLALEKYNGRK